MFQIGLIFISYARKYHHFWFLLFQHVPPLHPKVTHVSYVKPFLHNTNKQKILPSDFQQSELNNICKCIYAYRKKLISEKNVNPVNEKIEENWRGKWLTWKHIPLANKNVYDPPLTSNRKRQTAVCGKWKKRQSQRSLMRRI